MLNLGGGAMGGGSDPWYQWTTMRPGTHPTVHIHNQMNTIFVLRCIIIVSREITTVKFMLISPANHSEDHDKK